MRWLWWLFGVRVERSTVAHLGVCFSRCRGVVGQYRSQREKPAFGFTEDIMLPWYAELAKQYTAGAWNSWRGNVSLLELYEAMAAARGEARSDTLLDHHLGQ